MKKNNKLNPVEIVLKKAILMLLKKGSTHHEIFSLLDGQPDANRKYRKKKQLEKILQIIAKEMEVDHVEL